MKKSELTREERAKEMGLIMCEDCGYCNQPFNVKKYGTCTCCGKILNAKAKFFYEIKIKTKNKKIHY